MATLLQSFRGSTASATSLAINVGASFSNGTVDTTHGSLLVAYVASETPSRTVAASDNVNGAYTVDSGAASSCGICTFPNAAGGAITITGTISGAATLISVIFEEWSGIATTTPVDQHPAATNGGNVTTLNSNSTGTLNQANELILTACRTQVAVSSYTVSGPFTAGPQSPNGNYHATGYQIVSSTTAQTSTFSWVTGANSCSVAIATYKLAAVNVQNLPFYSRKYVLFNT